MRKALKLVPRPEEQFVERYERLHAWALSLTSGNEDQANDLVHDAFIQFILRRDELGEIQNPDGYLRRMLRNIFVSRLRRSASLQQFVSSVADYDSAELGLRIVDPHDQMQIANELRRICLYASERKETSKVGSVLIMRFFHGYYMNEIGQVLRSPMDSIYTFLKLARREAKLFLDDPASMKFVVSQASREGAGNAEAKRNPSKLLTELRDFIFRSRRGACIPPERLTRFYAKTADEKFEATDVAHIVSCPTCLDEVNQMLELPFLAERYPTDTLGDSDERGRRGGDDGGPTDGGGGSPVSTLKRKHSRRFKEVFDHRPQELRIAVNGFVLGSQKVGQEVNEQTISVHIDEQISFVEVISEQGLLLLCSEVEQPVEGGIEQSAQARFSDGRRLELSLDFLGAWPTLHVLYRDPAFRSAGSAASEIVEESTTPGQDRREVGAIDRLIDPTVSRARHRLAAWWRSMSDRGFWLRPATVTALIALVLVSVFLFTEFKRGPVSPPTASTLLAQAATAEQLIAAKTDQVIHRTINLEEKKVTGELVAHQRIEIWQSAEKGITARRLFDDRDALVAGDWRRADGVETIYHHGVRPQLQLAPEKRPALPASFDEVWQLDPSAKDFSRLIEETQKASVEEKANTYSITYESASTGNESSAARGIHLVKAALVLNRVDLHPIEQTLVFRQGDEIRSFKFVETAFEGRSPTTVAPAVFEPDAVLTGSAARTEKTEPKSETKTSSSPSPNLATSELEVEVLGRMNQAGAFLGEQLSVTRTPEGALLVHGIVETDQRKSEILRSLGDVTRNPAVKVRIETVAEAQKRQPVAASNPITLQGVEVTQGGAPAETDLRNYFAGKRGLSGDALDQEMRRFSVRVFNRSLQARQHALALTQIAARFSTADLQTMNPEARAKWRAMLSDHARSFRKEMAVLRQELEPIFPALSSGTANVEIASDADLASAAKRLFELASANDDAISRSFSISAENSKSAPIKTAQFWRALSNAESIAEKIQRAASIK
jgi:RNA polymerase sigma factor (sigma-70 family)